MAATLTPSSTPYIPTPAKVGLFGLVCKLLPKQGSLPRPSFSSTEGQDSCKAMALLCDDVRTAKRALHGNKARTPGW